MPPQRPTTSQVVAYVNGLPYRAEDLERREELIGELVKRYRDPEWRQFLDGQQNAKIEYVGQGG